MSDLSKKEKEYVDLESIIGDEQQPHEQQINPIWSNQIEVTWNIINWLKARNVSKKHLLAGKTLYYNNEFEGYESMKKYVEVKLLSNGITPKYENDWK